MGIGVSFTETPVPLVPFRVDAFGSRFVLDLLVKMTNLCASGGSVKGMQGLLMETHDKSPNIGTGFPMREDIGNGQGRKSKDFGELHLEGAWSTTDGMIVMM
jgi:hypothetical protein